MYKQIITDLVSTKLDVEKEIIERLINDVEDNKMGDYAIPCFSLAKVMHRSPKQIADELAETLVLPEEFDRCESVNGYLNFFVNREKFVHSTLNEVSAKGENYGSSNIGRNKKCLIEHTSTNPNASPHIGRARNAMIGDFATRLMRFEGYDVDVHYFVNDIGKQISMLVLGAKDKGDIKFEEILNLYIEINEKVKENPELEKDVFDLLYKLEQGDEETRKEFRRIVDICIKGQVAILNEFGIDYDHYDYESQFLFNNSMNEILDKLQEKGILFEDADGRLVVNLESHNLSPLVVARGNKTSLYPLRDLAYTQYKCSQGADKNIIVLGEDQKLYDKQICAIMSELGFVPPEVIHYSFVLLAEGKMSTRNGTVVLLEDLMRDAIVKVKEKVVQSGRNLSDDKIKNIAYGTIKYSILKASNDKNVVFDWDTALSFEGETGPYLQYCYARIKSIFRKVDFDYSNFDSKLLSNEIEFDILKTINQFKNIIHSCARDYSPHLLCNYIHTLARKFSTYYHDFSVLNEINEEIKKARLNLLASIKQIFETGLTLLGIELIDEM